MGPPSAYVGQPPLTPDDTLTIHGWQVLRGQRTADPSKGLKIALRPPPPGQPHESVTAAMTAGAVVSMVLMMIFTGTRLLVRVTNRDLRWGRDDWAILVATVGLSWDLDGGVLEFFSKAISIWWVSALIV